MNNWFTREGSSLANNWSGWRFAGARIRRAFAKCDPDSPTSGAAT